MLSGGLLNFFTSSTLTLDLWVTYTAATESFTADLPVCPLFLLNQGDFVLCDL